MAEYVLCHLIVSRGTDAATGSAAKLVSLGSTSSSYDHAGATEFSRSCAHILGQRSSDAGKSILQTLLIIGLDGCTNGGEVWRAYNGPEGLHRRFIANGMKQANRVLEYGAFEHGNWKVEGRWENSKGGHFQYVVPQRDHEIKGREFRKGEPSKLFRGRDGVTLADMRYIYLGLSFEGSVVETFYGG
ncbi:hypothetical protein VTL71DRAFT_5951 [Oculimacula yallundae]|uniref:Histidine-specific methyltransferase SAM-dependent domain-containing protein n=1 Tax=Oculimacula yallundae TaxID=86028 RepID=A0ABR4BYY6_9HELO